MGHHCKEVAANAGSTPAVASSLARPGTANSRNHKRIPGERDVTGLQPCPSISCSFLSQSLCTYKKWWFFVTL